MSKGLRRSHAQRFPPGSPFGRAFVAILDRRGLTYSGASDLIDVDHSLISRWVSGARNPPFDVLGRMCEGLTLTDAEALTLYDAADWLPPSLRDRIVEALG